VKQLFAILLSTLALTLFAWAQDDTVPAIGTPDDTATATDNPTEITLTNVFVLGDSLAGGLGAGMKRLTEGSAQFNVQLRFQEDSGLSRADFYDWPDAVSKIAESNEVDSAVVMIGTNDVRPIRVGDAVYEFGTPEWSKAYIAEIDRLLASLKRTGAAVHWVSLPPMANPEYDHAIAAIAELQRKQVEAAGLHYIDIRKDLLNADGSYMERGPDDTGAIRKLRDRDGVHFMKVGNNKIGSLVLAALSASAPQQATPAVPETPQLPQVSVPEIPGSGPIFGQMASQGTINVLRPGLETADQTLQSQPAARGSGTFAEGSAAQQLFVKGQKPAAQPGRFDDFTYVAPVQP
jgi:hypothetical protein